MVYVQWKTPDDGRRNCLKHVEFYSKNRSEKLVHLVYFITRVYHEALSTQRQIYQQYLLPYPSPRYTEQKIVSL